MKAAIYYEFKKPLVIENVKEAKTDTDGVVIEVKATGICRSDWHGWQANDPDIALPHVPGHELAGIIAEVGKNVKKWHIGDRVTVPFVCGCGCCPQCNAGNQQVCDNQFQPGFTHWGSFAEYVSIKYADENLVKLPEEIDFNTAASLGCRFVTSYRAIVDQGKVAAGQWVAIHGCGGVGLAAVMIAHAYRAKVVAVDIAEEKLALAKSLGAKAVFNSLNEDDLISSIKDLTSGGVHISLDALGHPETCFNSIANLRKRGKHIQVGIMETGYKNSAVPMDTIIANELEILGSHGIQSYRYPEILQLIKRRKLAPQKLIDKKITLEESLKALKDMGTFKSKGITIINKF